MFQVHSYTGVPQIGDLDSSICMILLSFQFVISAYNLAPHLSLKHSGMIPRGIGKMGAVISAESRQLTDIVSTLLSWPTALCLFTLSMSLLQRELKVAASFFWGIIE